MRVDKIIKQIIKQPIYSNPIKNGVWIGFPEKEVQQHLEYIKQLKELEPLKPIGVKPNKK